MSQYLPEMRREVKTVIKNTLTHNHRAPSPPAPTAATMSEAGILGGKQADVGALNGEDEPHNCRRASASSQSRDPTLSTS